MRLAGCIKGFLVSFWVLGGPLWYGREEQPVCCLVEDLRMLASAGGIRRKFGKDVLPVLENLIFS